jgi:hypothetical protein
MQPDLRLGSRRFSSLLGRSLTTRHDVPKMCPTAMATISGTIYLAAAIDVPS